MRIGSLPPARVVRLVHPFPSFVNAALVLGLGLVAGGSVGRSLALAMAMLGLQFCIGTVNDVVDAPLDARTKTWKPIPSGLVSRRAALVLAVVCGAIGLGIPGLIEHYAPDLRDARPLLVSLSAAMLGAGLVYDVFLKPTRWAWICFAVAFPLLPIYAWYGVAATLPPRLEVLLPLAALAGPLLQLSNGLSDLESDRAAGMATLATRLGRDRSLAAIAVMLAIVHGLAWLTLDRTGDDGPLMLTLAASALALLGLMLSASLSRGRRELGWMVQASSIALLGLGWLAAVV